MAGTIARNAGRGKGFARDEGDSHDVWVAVISRSCAGVRLSGRGAREKGWRDHRREKQCAGVRLRIANLQQSIWGVAESVRPDENLRRQHRGRSSGGGMRNGAAGRWQRYGRVVAESAEFLWSGGNKALAGPRA